MNKEELISFFETFNIEKEIIEKYLKDKNLFDLNGNIFLRKESFNGKEIFDSSLVFIKLKKLLPSKYLLEFIKNNTKNIIDLDSRKKALNFTYGKDIEFPLVKKEQNFIITFENEILGYASYKKRTLINEMNIGEYLKEN